MGVLPVSLLRRSGSAGQGVREWVRVLGAVGAGTQTPTMLLRRTACTPGPPMNG